VILLPNTAPCNTRQIHHNKLQKSQPIGRKKKKRKETHILLREDEIVVENDWAVISRHLQKTRIFALTFYLVLFFFKFFNKKKKSNASNKQPISTVTTQEKEETGQKGRARQDIYRNATGAKSEKEKTRKRKKKELY